MNGSTNFRAAFMAGLAAPTALWATPTDYRRHMGGFDVGQSFGAVATLLNRALRQEHDDGRTGRPSRGA